MANLSFLELSLLSMREKKAKKIEFDRKRTIVRGGNSTGKSCLLKSIYQTLGASPAKTHPDWDDADVILFLKFSVGNAIYHVLKHGKFYLAFDSAGNFLNRYDNVTNGIGLFVSQLCNFRIKLSNRQSELITPPPAYLFIPYYIDQDSSWKSSWSSFAHLAQFPHWKEPIVNYHVGIRPNEFYDIKGKIDGLNFSIDAHNKEIKTLEAIKTRISKKLTAVAFNMSLEQFQKQIEQLLIECQQLKKEQDELKNRLVELYNIKIAFEAQISLVNKALIETKGDYEFATTKAPHDFIECPTCGAEYENSFAERFSIAKDEDSCVHLLLQLQTELNETDSKIAKHNNNFLQRTKEIERIEELLNQKQGEVKLRDLIESEGKRELTSVLESQMSDIESEITKHYLDINGLKRELAKYENAERRKSIKALYRSFMKQYLFHLDVHSLKESSYKEVTSTIKETGSALPRALIAYYFSILQVMKEYASSVYCPIVIDSPNQQAQDKNNLIGILNFIKKHQPEGSQLVLGLEEDLGIDFGCKIIELKEKYSLLQKSEFNSVYTELKPFLNVAINAS
jgi:hypothetical protein